MYSGITGEEFAADIYIGVVFYQRLRHMVLDKFQVRTTGPVDPVTQQPVKVRFFFAFTFAAFFLCWGGGGFIFLCCGWPDTRADPQPQIPKSKIPIQFIPPPRYGLPTHTLSIFQFFSL